MKHQFPNPIKKNLLYFVSMCSLISLPAAASEFIPPNATQYQFYDGALIDADYAPFTTPQKHYEEGIIAFNSTNWEKAQQHFQIITTNYPELIDFQDSYFFLAVCLYNLGEYDLSDEAINRYFALNSHPKYFEEAISYKFGIATAFKNGAKRRFFGSTLLPKWASGWEMSLQLYDEVLAAVPCHDLAAWSLFEKADMLLQERDYYESIDTYQQVIRRFPKHELAPQSYIEISKIYLDQSYFEMHNPDLLALAEINAKRFRQDFSRDPRIEYVEQNVHAIKEYYAGSHFDTGCYYERKEFFRAAIIYYRKAIELFPDTIIAEKCRDRMRVLWPEGLIEVAIDEEGNTEKSSPAEMLPSLEQQSA